MPTTTLGRAVGIQDFFFCSPSMPRDAEAEARAEEAGVPTDYRQLRACQRCHLVLPLKQFNK